MQIKSIQAKLLISFLPMVLLFLGSMAAISYYFSNQALTKSVNETAMALGKDYAGRIQANIKELQIQLEDLASIQRIRSGADRAQIIEAMAEAHKRIGRLDVVNFIFPDGSTIRFNGETAQLGDREYFKKVVQTKAAYVSDPLVVRSTGKMSINIAVPVLNNGVLTGVLTGTYSLERMTDLVKAVRFKTSGYGAIIDDSGLTIAHGKRPDMNGKLNLSQKQINPELKLSDKELDDRLLQMFKAVGATNAPAMGSYRFGGAEILSVFTPVELAGGARWIMIISAPMEEATQETAALTKIMVVMALGGIVLAGILIMLFARRFAAPVKLIRDEAALMTQGDLRERPMRIDSADEIGQLARGFKAMSENLRKLIQNVQKQSEQVAASSQELTSAASESAKVSESVAITAETMSKGAEKQVSAVNDAAAIIEELSAAIDGIAVTAGNLAAMAAQTSDRTEGGRQNVEKAIAQINSVGQGTDEMAQTVDSLKGSSQKIAEIVNLISGIAGQTNLLALNAAIEAARAGEQGKGFAVVADEVRKLAEQSEGAAKQIADLINKNNEQITMTVSRMDRAKADVAEGVAMVNAAGQTFADIFKAVSELSAKIRDISASVEEMAAGSQRIIHSVEDVQSVSQKNALDTESISAAMEEQSAAMEQISASSRDLAQMAGVLAESVHKFRI